MNTAKSFAAACPTKSENSSNPSAGPSLKARRTQTSRAANGSRKSENGPSCLPGGQGPSRTAFPRTISSPTWLPNSPTWTPPSRATNPPLTTPITCSSAGKNTAAKPLLCCVHAEVLHRFGDPANGVAPRLFIHERCARLIECLPSLQHDPNRPEDVLKVDADEDGVGGDDTADCVRYLVTTKSRVVVQRKLRGL